MMRSILLFSLFLLISGLQAQVSVKIYAEPAELKSLGNRTLVVELPEENPKVIEDFPKKKAAEKTEAYRASLASYREQIEPAIKEHWKFNKDIEFKTTSEIIALFQKKSNKYVALMKVVLPDGGGVSGYTFGLGVPALVLTRTDGDSKVNKKGELNIIKHDFQSYLVVSPDSTEREVYSPASMKATLILAQDYLNWNIKADKSKDFMAYSKAMGKKNCGSLAQRTLLVNEKGLYKGCTVEEAHENYPYKLEFVDRSVLESTYLGGDATKAVLISIPVGTVQGTMIVASVTYLAFSKLILDPATGEIISSHNPGMGKSITEGLLKGDFKSLSKCE